MARFEAAKATRMKTMTDRRARSSTPTFSPESVQTANIRLIVKNRSERNDDKDNRTIILPRWAHEETLLVQAVVEDRSRHRARVVALQIVNYKLWNNTF